ncbi:MaoC family dehydratase N-terminal domain-containing protein [Paraburkholderia agricolaris]|uniref:MaoC family dehydratase N-terminal domain-containing protein n=1 Tax=Paraburkholderia agricolaris TaxID=2152888 RepID=UPI001291B995|nr:MaoC family dehydratase N-terminal domain-containing protein [Paraburkholderia agricolaris]
MIDKKWIGYEIGSSTFHIEAGRLKFFAKSIGETNPIYTDETVARAAGYTDIPAPPTFLFAAELDSGATFHLFDLMGVPLERLLHGEQNFEFFGPVVASDTVTVTSQIKDIYEKKGGALEFIEVASNVVSDRGDLVARMRSVTIIRN